MAQNFANNKYETSAEFYYKTMENLVETATAQFALIAALGLTCQWLAWRSHIPAILFLLTTGIVCGP